MQLYFMDLSENTDPSRYDVLLSLLPAERQIEISGFRFAEDRRLRVMADVLVRSRISHMLHVPFSDLQFGTNQYGKPHLIDHPSVHFNISHTRNALAVGLADEPLGIDVERITQADIRIARRAFTPDECAYVFADPQKQDERFFQVWTQKEAYMKWTGSGFHMDPRKLDVMNQVGLLPDARIHSIKIHDYYLSYCAAVESGHEDVRILSEKELYNDCISILP